MPTSSTPVYNLRQACARQFADRPTLRQVASQQILKLLLAELPWLAAVQPALADADPFTLDSPDPDTAYWTTAPLVDVVLQALVHGTQLNLEPLGARTYNLGLNSPYRFAGSSSEFDTRSLNAVSDAFNELLQALPAHFCQAQVDYWNAVPCIAPGDCGVSRHRWMQQALRSALLSGIQSQSLAGDASECLHELLAGRTAAMQVNAIELTLHGGGIERRVMLADLLVMLERDERRLLLWCPPSGMALAFTSLEEFSLALRDREAARHGFDKLSWSLYELQGNPFLQQSALLLDWMLERLQHLPWQSIDSVAKLEAWYAGLSDPCPMFLDGAGFATQEETPALPDWLEQASSQDRFEYQVATLDLAVEQALSQGKGSLDGVLDLLSYTRQRLRKQLLADHPQDANYFPDDLMLTVKTAQGVPGGAATGTGDGVVSWRVMTLTEFAIGNLSALGHGIIDSISHREDQLIMDWLDASYLKALVDKVDIGGHYPVYVATTLNDPATRDERVRCFAREWRSQLLFDALKLKIDGGLDLAAWEGLAEFCRSGLDLKLNVDIAPLAFRAPDYRAGDTVTCMYVLRLYRPQAWLLYRPLHRDAPLLCYADRDALMAAIRQDGELQQSVLEWLADEPREVYQDGGFEQPHRLTGWAGQATEQLVPASSLASGAIAQPAELAFKPWLADVDAHLFAGKLRALTELADRQTVSSAESRWSRMMEASWLLFNVVAPVLRGPVALVAWLVSSINALESDVQALSEEDDAEKSLAIMDILSNLSMVIAHSRMPQANAVAEVSTGAVGNEALRMPTPALAPVEMGKAHLPGALQTLDSGSVTLATGWGPEPAAQLKTLLGLVSTVDLEGVVEADGFYQQAGERYVELYGEHFKVEQFGADVRVVSPEGQLGPWLWRGEQWKVRTGFFGGMPPTKGVLPRRQAQFDKIDREMTATMGDAAKLRQLINEESMSVINLDEELTSHEARLEQLTQGVVTGLTQEQIDENAEDARKKIAQQAPELRRLREGVINNLLAVIGYDKVILRSMSQLLELQRFGTRRGYVVEEANRLITRTRNTLVLSSWNVFDELRRMADYPELQRLSGILDGRLIAEVRPEYHALKTQLRSVVRSQAQMIQASIDLDTYLPEIVPKTVLNPPLELPSSALGTASQADPQAPDQPLFIPVTAKMVVSFRPMTTVQLRFHQAMNYTDLALDLSRRGQARKQSRYRHQLASDALKSAASAHSALSTSVLSPADRIEILQNAWDEYSAAIINSFDIVREGGTLVEVDMLERYVDELKALKAMIGVQLEEAIAEQDGVVLPKRHPAYRIDQSKQQLVRTRKGELLVGRPVRADGADRLEVRDPFTNELLHRFEPNGLGGWVEADESEAPQVSKDGSDMMALEQFAELLLKEGAQVERKVQEYIEAEVRGHQLTDLIDGHVQELRNTVQRMAGSAGTADLAARLEAQVEHWTKRRNDSLIKLYENTHYPDADALAYMHAQGLIEVVYQGSRQQLADGTAMDEYLIKRRVPGGKKKMSTLWVAHFHFAQLADDPTQFVRGHLKTWQQRFYGTNDARQLALMGQRIHRGPLTYDQVKNIMPFH